LGQNQGFLLKEFEYPIKVRQRTLSEKYLGHSD